MAATNYIWDFATDSYLMEKDDGGNTTAVYTNEPVKYGRLISQRRGSTTSYYHFDGQGSTRQLTNPSGDVTDEYAYSAFGETIATSGSTAHHFRVTGIVGYYSDLDIGNVYVRLRSLNVGDGRWLSRDVVTITGSMHYFLYVHNSPIAQCDPSGAFASALLPTREVFDRIIERLDGPMFPENPWYEYVYRQCRFVCFPCVVAKGVVFFPATVEQIALEAERIADEMVLQIGEANDGVWPDLDIFTPEGRIHHGTRQNSALRHCIWSGLMAKRIGSCGCSKCLADARDIYQAIDPQQHQSFEHTAQSIFNNAAGRRCAGCFNVGNPTTIEHPGAAWFPDSYIVQCCREGLLRGRLATGVTGPALR